MLSGHDESANTILLETAGASGSGLAILVTRSCAHVIVKLSSVVFSLESV